MLRMGILQMPTRPCKLFPALAALGALLLLCASPARAQLIPDEMPPPVRGLEIANNLGKQVPLSLQFTTSEGRIVSLGTFFNRPASSGKDRLKPVVIQMMYYRCSILCPTVLNKFTTAIQPIDFTVGKDFDVLIVSIDPRDTPSQAAVQQAAQVMAYNRPGGDIVRDGWNFVTSSPESARALAEALGFGYRYLPESGEYSHGAALFVLTPDGKVSRTLTGLNYPASDVRLALLEASGGRIGTVFDAFTLWCYHFDPSTGTYTLAAMRIMRAGSGITVALIAALLAVMWRHEHRKKRAVGATGLTALGPTREDLSTTQYPPPPAPLTGPTS